MKAFPVVYMDYIPSDENRGMDLRDYFAAKAMPIIMKDWYDDGFPCGDNDNAQAIAEFSYLMADAMMKAREQ